MQGARASCRVRLGFVVENVSAASRRREGAREGAARGGRRALFLRSRFYFCASLNTSYFGIMATNVTVSLDQVPVMASAVAPTIVPRPVIAPVPVGDGGVTDSAPVSQPVVAVPSAPFDARLIPEFDGTEDVVSWLARAEMLCQLRGVAAETVIPLRLAGGAFHVWSQLPAASRCSLTAVRDALQAAFALDEYAAYEAFAARRLMPGESADVFLADLRRLAALF